MGLGQYVIAEWQSLQEENSIFKNSFKKLEQKTILKCTNDWFPKKTPQEACGYATPRSGEQFGRVPIPSGLFDDHSDAQMSTTWRQSFTTSGHQTLMTGTNSGNVLPEDVKVAWIGIMLPNKDQMLTEIRYHIGDQKYGRLNLEEIHAYEKPAIIFEDGYIINEEEGFEMWGYIEGPIPIQATFITSAYQNIILIGACYYKQIDKFLGNCGATIT